MSDDQVMQYLFEEFGISDGQQLQHLDKEQRNDIHFRIAEQTCRHSSTPTTNRNGQEYHFKYFKNYFEPAGTRTCPSVLILKTIASYALTVNTLPHMMFKIGTLSVSILSIKKV